MKYIIGFYIILLGIIILLLILQTKISYFVNEPTYIIIPQRDRDIYMNKLLIELPKYLRRVHPNMRYELIVSHQNPGGKYNKCLSINVALAWLHKVKKVPIDSSIVIQDVDAIPLEYVDYRPVDVNKFVGCFLTIGGIKSRLWQLIKCNGYANTMKGWGYEDMLLWSRIEKMCGINISWWKNEIKDGTKAVVKNLEWNMSDEVTKINSDNYWKNMNFYNKIRFVSGGIEKSKRPKRIWKDNATTYRNWCLYRKTKDFDIDTFSRIVRNDGISNIVTKNINYIKERNVHHLYFDVIDVYNKSIPEPELKWYDDLTTLPADCPIDVPS